VSDAPYAPVRSIAHSDDRGLMNRGGETIVFAASRVTEPSVAGAKHDLEKHRALYKLGHARSERAQRLAERKDKESEKLQKDLLVDIQRTCEHTQEHVQKSVLEWGEALQALLSEEERERKKREKQFKEPSKDAMMLHRFTRKVSSNVSGAVRRAEQAQEEARRQAKLAAQAKLDVKSLPAEKRHISKFQAAKASDDKPPSSLRIFISEGVNFPRIKMYKSVDAYCRFLLTKPGDELNDQDHTTGIKWRQHNPVFNENVEFVVQDSWGDVVRDETLLCEFYDSNAVQGLTTTGVIGGDNILGVVRIPLNDFLKRKEVIRYPDGDVDPAHFVGALDEWFELKDADTGDPIMGTDDPEAPAVVQMKISFVDSASKKQTGPSGPGIHPVQLPPREEFQAPLARPPPSWRTHPA